MKKIDIIKWMNIVAKLLALLAGLASYQDIIPQTYLPYALALFGMASLTKDTLIHIADILDDGVENGSIKDTTVSTETTSTVKTNS